MQDIKNRLVELAREEFGDSVAEQGQRGEDVFAPHGAGWSTGMLDSLDRMEFVMIAEEAFKVDIPDAIVVGIRTIDQLAEYIATMTSQPAHAGH